MRLNYLETRLKLIGLWLFVLLNIIFRDIHQLTMKSHLEMLLTGYFNGTEVTESIMLFGAIIVNIPISMLLVSLYCKRKVGRVLNILAALILGFSFVLSPPSDMDDVFHLIVECLALFAVVVTASGWRSQKIL